MGHMIKGLLALSLLAWSCMAQAQTWLHVTGLSWHDRPGYNGTNTGFGLETQIEPRWSGALGVYHNSLYRTTLYAVGKYQWIQQGAWQINVNMGAATGYEPGPIGPVLMPELCLAWVCVFATPRLGRDTTSAAVIYLRIPIGQPGS